MNFSDFSLHESLLKGISSSGYVTCTPVQEQVLKTSLTGDDLYVQSQTGTGKTAAYLVSIIEQMLAWLDKETPQKKKALVLVPTRELAVQVEDEAKKLISGTNFKAYSFYGGVGYANQIKAIESGVDFIIGTPGRIIDLKKGGQLDLSAVAFLVVDEADRMFDMGFYPDLREILKFVPAPESRQTMLLSATLNTFVKNLAWEYTRDAKEITIEAENITVDEIDQELIHVSSDKKLQLLLGILERENPSSVVIFCNTKRGAEILGKRLKINDFDSEFIIGDMQQSKRLEVMKRFKDGKVSILVATDVAARGIDVNDLAMVVNYDLPTEPENYVHRIGRTARAGKSGKAYTFCSEKDVYDLVPIERFIDKKIPSIVCSDDMLVEDKSKGTYIRLDSQGYDDDDFGRGKKSRSKDKKGKKRDSDKSKKKDFSKKERDASKKKNGERGEGFNLPREVDKSLEGLSFEERMEVYKKKYAGTSPKNSSKKGDKKNERKGKKNSQKGFDKKQQKPQKQKASTAPQYQQKNKKSLQSKPVEKKGILSIIKSFFSKN